MTIPLHGHTHRPTTGEPITRYQDDPRWQELDKEFGELSKSDGFQDNLVRISELSWQMREIERIYEQLDARKALIGRILFDHPAGAALSSSDAEALADAIALKLI